MSACRCARCRAPGDWRRGGKTFVARCLPNGNLRAAVRRFFGGRNVCRCRSRRPDHVRHNRCCQSQGGNSEKTSSRGLVCRKRLLYVSFAMQVGCGCFEFLGYYPLRRGPSANWRTSLFPRLECGGVGVNKFYKKGCQEKSSPSTGGARRFCLEIQPTSL